MTFFRLAGRADARAPGASHLSAMACIVLAALVLVAPVLPLAWPGAAVRGLTTASAVACLCLAMAHLLQSATHRRAQFGVQVLALLSLIAPWCWPAATVSWTASDARTAPASLLLTIGLGCSAVSLLRMPGCRLGRGGAIVFRWLPAVGLAIATLLGLMSLVMAREDDGLWEAPLRVGAGTVFALALLTWRSVVDRDDDSLASFREDHRISLMSLAVLITVVVVTGIATFWAVQSRLQESERERLVQSVYRREMAFNFQLANAVRAATDLAAGPALAEAMAHAARRPDMAAPELAFQLLNMSREGFTAIRFEVVGIPTPLPAHGEFVTSTTPVVALEHATEAELELLWRRGLVANVRVPVQKQGQTVGWVVSQQPLELMTAQLFERSDVGDQVEVDLCAPRSRTEAWCMPSSPDGPPRSLPLVDVRGEPSAIGLGIRGDQGVRLTTDDNGTRVLDVYATVQRPLGLQLRQSIDTVMAPVRTKLRQTFAVILAMVAVGILILSLQVRPLASRLVTNEQRLSMVMANVRDGIVTTGADGRITYLNAAAERMTGWTRGEALGRSVVEVYHVVDAVTGQAAPSLVGAALAGDAGHEHADVDVVHRVDGTRRPVHATVSLVHDAGDAVMGTVLVFHDATVVRARAAAIRHEASHDPLTGLANRKEFERQMHALIDPNTTDPRHHALLFVDLDRFKQVNDTAGHAAGDELLRQVTRIMQRALRTSDLLARIGGDEFTIILPSCGLADARRIAEGLLAEVTAFQFEWEGRRFQVGTSIGVAVFDGHCRDDTRIMAAADAACYRAKHAGRHNVQVHAEVLSG